MTLQDQLDALARMLIKEASNPKTDLVTKEKVEIFKATAAWALGNAKKKLPEDDDPAATFEALRTKINGKGVVQ